MSAYLLLIPIAYLVLGITILIIGVAKWLRPSLTTEY